MIVKIPPKRRDAKSSFKDLTKYITEEFNRDDIDIGMPGFGNLTQYITRESVPDILSGLTVEKTIGIEIGNLNSLETAPQEMYAVAKMNLRVEDPAFHYIISWPSNERPEVREIMGAARDTLEALGLSDHQYIIAVHANTDNLHAHIEVNRVHPKTYKSHHIQWAKKTLHRAAREAEIKYGWSHDNGIYEVVEIDGKKIIVERDSAAATPKTEGKGNLFETWSGEMSLETWCKDKPATVLKRLLPSVSSWQDIHQILDAYGLELIDSGGGGMKVRTHLDKDNKRVSVSASKAFRFLKRKDLEFSIGSFKPFVKEAENDRERRASIADIEQNLRTASDHLQSIGQLDSANADAIRTNVANLTATADPIWARSKSSNSDSGHRIDERGDALNESEYYTVIESNLSAAGRNLEKIGSLDSDFARAAQARRASLTGIAEAVGGEDRTIEGSSRNGNGEGRSYSVTSYKRDPEKRLQAKLERADIRQALIARFRKDKLVHNSVRQKMTKELKEKHDAIYSEIIEFSVRSRSAIKSDLRMSPEEKRQTYALLAHQTQVRKEEYKALVSQARSDLKKAFEGMPVASWRSWVEDLALQGDEAAISALRGILYQEGRDKKKLQKNNESELLEYAYIQAPPAGTHDPRVARNLRFKLFDGKLLFNFKDGRPAFVDNGETISWDRASVDDDALRLSLAHAAEKWGKKFSVQGGDEIFQNRLMSMAEEMGIDITILRKKRMDTIATNIPSAPAAAVIDNKIPAVVAPGLKQNKYEELVSLLRRANPEVTVHSVTSDANETYRGVIEKADNDFVVQRIDTNTLAIHSADSFSQLPKQGSSLSIKYKNTKATIRIIKSGVTRTR